MNPAELVIGLIFLATLLTAFAQRIGVAYPIVLVLGGLVLGFVPGMPVVRLDPETVFLVFIPPLVYLPSSQVALLDLRRSWFSIAMLSIGLVLVNLIVVAGVMHVVGPRLDWPTAFVLAAIVAPTDMIAVNAIIRRTPVPGTVSRILDGEGLFNDVVAFVAYKIAIQAVVSQSYSLQETLLEFAWDSAAGITVGVLVGWLAIWIRSRVQDSAINSAISLLTAFTAYLAGEAIQASGVLATVAAGLTVGRALSRILEPGVRQESFSFWAGFNFILEGLAFVLVGLELRPILVSLKNDPPAHLLGSAMIVCGTVILVRLVWVATTFLVRSLLERQREHAARFSEWRSAAIVAWSGTRGIDSLAAALGIPLLLPDGHSPFPDRDVVLFLSFSVILVTLVFQGSTLPALIRWCSITADDAARDEEHLARYAAAEAALAILNQTHPATEELADVIHHFKTLLEHQLRLYQSVQPPLAEAEISPALVSVDTLKLQILHAQREAVLKLRDQGLIRNAVLRKIERSLDLEEIRLTS